MAEGVTGGVPLWVGVTEGDTPPVKEAVGVGVGVDEGVLDPPAGPPVDALRVGVGVMVRVKLPVASGVEEELLGCPPPPPLPPPVSRPLMLRYWVELLKDQVREAYASAMSMGRNRVPKNPRYQDRYTNARAYRGDPFAP